MPPMHSGHTGEGQGDDGDDGVEFRPPLPPEDRIWRHPSEVAGTGLTGGSGAGQRRTPRIVGVALVSGLIGATLSLGVVAAVGGFSRTTAIVERNNAVQPITGLGSEADPVAAIVARTGPAVAAVRVDRDGTSVTGSAIVLRSDGHLLTNAHLVEGADTIAVRFHEGPATAATVVGSDPATDIAVLRVDVQRLEPAALGTADAVEIGDQAVALGAVGAAGWSTEVTTGVISSLDRRVRAPDGTVRHGMMIVDVRLGDASAGGPLLDASGAVVGVTSPAPATADGEPSGSGGAGQLFCLATPIDVASHVADQIIEHGRARPVWLGIEGTDLAADDAAGMGLPGGAAINRVLEGSPASSAGLADGDVIVEFDSRTIESMSDLISALRGHDPDQEVTVRVRRGDDELSMTVVLAEKDPA